MQTIDTADGMQAYAERVRAENRRLGLVPTMGFLHAGHLSLIRAARDVCDVVVVSLFVNPTQFAPGEDFDAYPRDAERDTRLCADEGVDVLFAPPATEMYAPGHSVHVEETRLARGLCGASRPAHFRGVTTVVAMLFNIVMPHAAVFGAKDAQQVRIVRQMIRDLHYPIRLIIAPTVREPDGLAMSSRNAYLSPSERLDARCLHAALQVARSLYARGERDAAVMLAQMKACIAAVPAARIEYVEIVDWDDLQAAATANERSLAAVAVRIGKTRLIDNLMLSPAARPDFAPRSLR